jgi:ABC-type branched-subunit amino acid transport system substrate-binding protein
VARPHRALAPVLLTALLTAGCGSTVAVRGDTLQPGGTTDGLVTADGGDGLSLDVPGGSPADGATTDSGTAAGATSSVGGGGSGAPGAGGAPGAAAPASGQGGAPLVPAGGRAGGNGPGVTADKVFVGVTYTANADAANAAIGASGITGSDQKANAQAVIDEINARGGVAGRELVPVFHAYDAQSSQSAEEQDQAACATFTQDNKVFAAGSGLTENLSACLDRAGVLQVNSGQLIDKDRVFYDKYPSYFDVGTLTQDRMMAEQVRALQRLDYFSGWDTNLARPGTAPTKLGVITFEDDSWLRPLARVMLPALAKAGHAVDPQLVYQVHKPENQADVARTATGVQNAVLRFRQSDVTHVVLLDASGTMTITFAGVARNQRYFPRLGMNSATAVQALYTSGVLDDQQVAGAVGLGWFPSIDLPEGEGDRYLGPATEQCLEVIQRRTGQTFSSTNASSLALVACDQYFLTAEAIKRAGATINRDTVRAALEGLGGGYAPALLAESFFGPGRHDGLQRGYDMAWDAGCRCVRYRDGGHPIP